LFFQRQTRWPEQHPVALGAGLQLGLQAWRTDTAPHFQLRLGLGTQPTVLSIKTHLSQFMP